MSKRTLLWAALSACSFAQAQEDTSGKELSNVVITASKFAQKQSNVGKVITIITQEQLRRASGRTLAEVLNSQAGFFVNGSQNTLGTNLDVYVRGAGSGKTLVLVDGVPAYDPSSTSTAFDLNLIPVNQIERVEVLKGSHSTLYGSDAVAGVIHIITKKNAGKPLNIAADLSGGSFGTYKGSLGIYGRKANTAYQVRYTKAISGGFSAANDKNGRGDFDRDGFDQDAVAASLTQSFNVLTLKLNGQLSGYKADLDAGAFTDERDFVFDSRAAAGSLGLEFKVQKAAFNFNYNYNHVKRTYTDDSLHVGGFARYSEGLYEGGSHFAELYGHVQPAKHWDIIAGIDYRRQSTDQRYLSISSFGPYKTALSNDSASLQQIAVYGSVVLKELHRFNIELGGRFNKFNNYDNVFTFSFNPSYSVNDRVKLFANLSSGFKAPSLYHLYSEYRNPVTELKPERSLSFDAGIQYQKEKANARATYFRRRITDNIVFYTSPAFQSYYINTDRQNDQGVELEASFTVGQWHADLNYTNVTGRVHTKINGKDTAFNNLFRRPQNTFNLNIGYTITPGLYASLGVRSASKRYEPVFGSATQVELDAYYTWNAYAEYRFTRYMKAFADLRNLTDEEYVDVYGYNSRRFNFMTGLQFIF